VKVFESGRARRSRIAALAVATCLGAVPAANAATCPGTVDGSDFASSKQLHKEVRKVNSYGPRILGSDAHNEAIKWLKRRAESIDDVETRYQPYKIYRWLPRTEMRQGPGLDISRAGSITLTQSSGSAVNVPDAGAVHWSKPTGKQGQSGQLVYLPPDEDITPANAAGKVVIRDFPSAPIPTAGIGLLGLYVTPDIVSAPDYDRPYLGGGLEHEDLLAAGQAGAAGVIFAFDVPRKQVEGYYDPHTGTIYDVPGVFVGSAEAQQLKAAVAQGDLASVSVRAKVDRTKTRNLIATVPGRSPQKISLMANTDGNSWVQEDGIIGMLALARYYESLPMPCRGRTLELAFTSAHDAIVEDGTGHYVPKLNDEYDGGKVAFGFAIEHLGTREILPTGAGADRHLAFTGKGDPFLFGAGDSDALRSAAVAATQRRNLDSTAVLTGLGVPVQGRVPPICSMGGLGTVFQRSLIPTLAMISGPWSLYDPVFGAKAIDFKRMRSQLLAAGDAILALDGLPRKQIAGDYLGYREQVAQGAPTCPPEIYPQFGPGPGG
jgi:hypothetical protein